MSTMTVYGMADSGNCYKVKLALAQLAHPAIAGSKSTSTRGETRTPEFLARNPNGRCRRSSSRTAPSCPSRTRSSAYLAEGTPLLPADRLARARVLQWMFFEQYSHEPYIAVARCILRYLPRRHAAPRRAAAAPGSAATRRSA